MIKIEVPKGTRKSINDKHKEYVERTSLQRLEKRIKAHDIGDMRCRLLKALFGETENERRECIIDVCLSTDLEDKLRCFNNAFKNLYGFKFESELKEHNKIIADTRTVLDHILNYDGFNVGGLLSGGKIWNRHIFITSLGIKVCPYCNRQYITSYENDEAESKTTADADHYYPKAQYPILQMNIFNLVPSCNVCNSKMKGASMRRHLYPYEDASDSMVFELPVEIGDRVSEIIIDTKMNHKAEASKDVFKLDKIYQAHLDETSEIKERARTYFEHCEKAYEATSGLNVPFNIFAAWFGFMGKDISSEPLIKLKQDIFNQLKAEFEKC